MTLNRRAVLGLISAGMMLPASLLHAQEDTRRIQREIDEATARGRPWLVPVGVTLSSGLRLPDGAHLIGARGRSKITLIGPAAFLVAERAQRITLESVVFDGAQRLGARNQGLLQFRDVPDLRLQDCTVERFGGAGITLERCGGRITGNQFQDTGRSAVFALDSQGLVIDGNRVRRSGENGILVWRSTKGDDGTIIRGNRIEDIRADAGGSGEYGNAIGLFRAGGLVVEGNVIRRAAYTAVRNNSGSNVVVSGNSIADCGEVALYSEFGFDGTAVTGNVIDGAQAGIVVTNFADQKGRIAAISGNVIRNVRAGKRLIDGETVGGQGIIAEGDAAITGNIIDGAAQAGLQLGWGPSLRDVTASGNTIRDCGNGIEISVAPGVGNVAVIGNTIASFRKQAIVGMQWKKQVTGDLAVTGTKDWPSIKLAENLIR
ncbi:MAG: TIGR03808 family TAT-translocated repetitive protein [Beijerinckiaceae bacterium]